MRALIIFISFITAIPLFGADWFQTKKLAINLEFKAPVKDSAFNTLALITDNDGNQFKIPCSILGSFLKKVDKNYVGYQRAYCELAKKGRDKKYDSINVTIDRHFKGKTPGDYTESKYVVSTDRTDDSSDDLLKTEWAILGGKEISNVELAERLDNLVAGSPFRLLALIESALVTHVGKLAYATEVERNVTTWGFTYFVGSDYEVSLDGRWGKTGAKYTIRDTFSALKKAGDLSVFIFADKEELTKRSAKIIPED